MGSTILIQRPFEFVNHTQPGTYEALDQRGQTKSNLGSRALRELYPVARRRGRGIQEKRPSIRTPAAIGRLMASLGLTSRWRRHGPSASSTADAIVEHPRLDWRAREAAGRRTISQLPCVVDGATCDSRSNEGIPRHRLAPSDTQSRNSGRLRCSRRPSLRPPLRHAGVAARVRRGLGRLDGVSRGNLRVGGRYRGLLRRRGARRHSRRRCLSWRSPRPRSAALLRRAPPRRAAAASFIA